MLRDIFSHGISVGDTVAFNPPVYKGLVKGKVIKLNKQMIRVKYTPTGKQHTTECNVWPTDVAINQFGDK